MNRNRLDPIHGYLEGVGSLRLHYRAWEADAPRGVIILVHGMFEHSRRYQEFGEVMAAHGLSTYALDLRGHGASEGRRGHVRTFDLLLQDLDRFRREVEGIVPAELPMFLVGHSLGGLIALRYLQEYDSPLRGSVITAPWLGTAVPVPRWQILLGHVLNRVMPAFPFPFHIDAAILSRDPARVADYQEDPEIHSTITPRMFTEISSAIHLAVQRGDRIHVPVHFLLAGDDRLVDTARSLAFARSLPEEMVSVEVVPDSYHELIQETNRAAVLSVIRERIQDELD
jgi:alpha-beta hydrolase superfamily lysophospholipase